MVIIFLKVKNGPTKHSSVKIPTRHYFLFDALMQTFNHSMRISRISLDVSLKALVNFFITRSDGYLSLLKWWLQSWRLQPMLSYPVIEDSISRSLEKNSRKVGKFFFDTFALVRFNSFKAYV